MSGTEEDLQKAETLVEIMSEDFPGLPNVMNLKLKLITAKSPEDTEGYARVVYKMIDATQLTDSNFTLVMGRIRDLVKMSSVKAACECLDVFIRKRLAAMEREDLLEKAFITRIYITIQDRTYGEEKVVDNLRALLDAISKQLKRSLRQGATNAAIGLLWRVSEAFYNQQKYKISSQWCRLALHVVFDKSGVLNIAKISRCVLSKAGYGNKLI